MSTRHATARAGAVPLVAIALLACAASQGTTTPKSRPSISPAPAAVTRAARSHIPLVFSPNAGQAAAAVRYVGRAPGVSVQFGQNSVAVALTRPSTESIVLALRFEHSNPRARISGASITPETVNNFHGNVAALWRTAIPTYSQVVYHQLWPGIDAMFTAHDGVLKYSFQVAPGADPNRIRIAYANARRISIASDGTLAISAAGTTLHDQAPISYQGFRRNAVATRYRLLGGTRFGLSVRGYDRSRSLTIDPGLDYSTYFGGSGNDVAWNAATDAAANLYVAGTTASTDLPITSRAPQRALNDGANSVCSDEPCADFFVLKLDPAGHPVYSTYIGGSGDEQGWGLAVDAAGDAYLSGSTLSRDFPVTARAYQHAPSPAITTGVVVRLNPTGSRLLYSTYLGPDLASRYIGVGRDGSVTIVASTMSDFAATTRGAYQPKDLGGHFVTYVARLDPTGSRLLFGTYVGAPGYGLDILTGALDAQGAVYLGGTASPGFPTTPGANEPTEPASPLGHTGIVIKLDPSGSRLDYATYYGSDDLSTNTGTVVTGIAVDGSGSAHFVADITPGADATMCQPGAWQCTAVAQLDPTGSRLESNAHFGGSGATDPEYSVAVDAAGLTYVVGTTLDADMPTTSDALFPTFGDHSAAFYLAVFSQNALVYATYFGGLDTTGGLANFSLGFITVAPNPTGGTVYLAGGTSATNFPVTAGAYQTTNHGGLYGEDAWAAKLTIPALAGH